MFSFYRFHIPETLCYCSQSFFHLAVWLSFLSVWPTVPVRLWAWPAGTSNHSGHLGGPNVTRFHRSLPASRLQRDGGKRHRGRGVFHLSVSSSISPSTSPRQTHIIGHIINFTAAVWEQVFSELSEGLCLSPELKGYMPWHRLSPRLRTAFYYCVQPLFEGYHTEFYLDTIHRQPNESKSAQGKSKGRSNTDCPAHTQKINAETRFLSLSVSDKIFPRLEAEVLKVLLLFLLFGYTIQLLTSTDFQRPLGFVNEKQLKTQKDEFEG